VALRGADADCGELRGCGKNSDWNEDVGVFADNRGWGASTRLFACPRRREVCRHDYASRELLVSHYSVPGLVGAGYACWIQGPRAVGNDLRLEHETAIIDVAAGMVHLKGLGFEHIVQLGNSGERGYSRFTISSRCSNRTDASKRHPAAGRAS